jgi:hypothetical protein
MKRWAARQPGAPAEQAATPCRPLIAPAAGSTVTAANTTTTATTTTIATTAATATVATTATVAATATTAVPAPTRGLAGQPLGTRLKLLGIALTP